MLLYSFFYLKLNFKLKLDANTRSLKNVKKKLKLKENLPKSVGNPVEATLKNTFCSFNFLIFFKF